MSSPGTTVKTLNLGAVNVSLILTDRPVLVDVGFAANAARIERFLEQSGVAQGGLSAIVLTHMHADHVGKARQLADAWGAELLFSETGATAAASGKNAPGEATRAWVALMGRLGLMPREFETLTADRYLHNGDALDVGSVQATVLTTPGHTDHCVSLVLEDGSAIIGDLLMGSPITRNRPSIPLLLWDRDAWIASLRRLAGQRWSIAYVGHGQPIDRASFDRFLATLN